METLLVVRPGLLTTVQDRGRWGYQDRGVPVAGPMDPVAHRTANALAGNPPEAAALEITLIGPELVCSDDRVMAVAGAAFDVSVGGRRVPPRGVFEAPRGATVAFGRRLGGARAYLAVSGGLDVPIVLGSRATHVMTRMGGLDGRPLRAGDDVPLGRPLECAGPPPPAAGGPSTDAAGLPPVVRVLPGPQEERFVADALGALQSGPYRLTPESDRTGYRLEGPTLAHSRRADVISDATPVGSLQVPSSGRPILLMADRQTAGGYPKIATVIAADLPVAGQLAPGDTVRFRVCSPREALSALIAQERTLMALERRGASG